MPQKNCNPKDCKIVDGLCLTHGYSVNDKVKCENYPDPRCFEFEEDEE